MKEYNDDDLLLVESDKKKKIEYHSNDPHTHDHSVVAGRGRCSECGCVQFVGDGGTCERGTCGHDYASHSNY